MTLLTSEGRALSPAVFSRRLRRDVVRVHPDADAYAGFRADFHVGKAEEPRELRLGDVVLRSWTEVPGCARADVHYAHLFDETRVLHREHIYGYGPPTDVSGEFKAFAVRAKGRVLDFGSGNGDLLRHLRGSGVDASGIELDEPRIRNALSDDVREHITLYDGALPLPFGDGSFDWIVSTEVIEHVPEVWRYVPDFWRLLKPGGSVLLTTPDISSIPSSFATATVPWHLLESTHINFFTPASLRAMFASHFELEELVSLGENRVNGFFVPGSMGAVLRRRDTPA